MEQLAPFKVSTELLDEEAVAGHICVLGVPVARRLLDHQVRVAITKDLANAEFFGKPEPVMSASYSATLLEAAKWICSTYLSLSPLGEVRTMPAPKPVRILEPSKSIRQLVESGAGGRY